MRILVACEESQAVQTEFMKRGHDAYSCDILPTSGMYPEWHLQQDVIPLFDQQWDRVISFPPCTHLAVSGAKHFAAKRADGRQREAIMFFLKIWKHSNVVENPIGIMNTPNYIAKWFPDIYIITVYRSGFHSGLNRSYSRINSAIHSRKQPAYGCVVFSR